jgi:hypothetical protein
MSLIESPRVQLVRLVHRFTVHRVPSTVLRRRLGSLRAAGRGAGAPTPITVHCSPFTRLSPLSLEILLFGALVAIPMIRLTLMAMLLSAATLGAEAGAITFATPREGEQVLGVAAIELAIGDVSIDRVDFYVDGTLVGVARQAPWRILHDFGDALSSRHIDARVFSDGFHSETGISVTTGSVVLHEKVQVDLVEVPLELRGSTSRLRPADLRVVEDGLDREVLELVPARLPSRFVFVVDRSSSMNEGKLAATLAAVERACNALRADDEAALLFFSHQVSPLRTITSCAVDEEITASGGTSLRDALVSIDSSSRTIVIAISDGDDRNSFTSTRDALDHLGHANITLYALALGRGEGAEFLRRSAGITGGSFRRTSRRNVEKDLMATIAELDRRWTLTYQSNAETIGWRSIDVESRKRGLQVRSVRSGYHVQDVH